MELPPNITINPKTGNWKIPSIDVRLIAHFWYADFFRIFGTNFNSTLLGIHLLEETDIVVQDRKRPQWKETRGGMKRPVLGHLQLPDRSFFELRLDTFDTMLPFIPKGLGDLSHLFLGIGKSDALSKDDLKDMLCVFRDRPHEAYRYAAIDVVNTLLLHEAMSKMDRSLYRQLEIPDHEIPPLRPTTGRRVNESMLHAMRILAETEGSRLQSKRSFEQLQHRGGIALFDANPSPSRYGRQTGKPHGGLLLSRSPTKVFHESPGMLRDVDLSACYSTIQSEISVYAGQALIIEPGDHGPVLKDAINFLRGLADDDAWCIRVTGIIDTIPNSLIPSTVGAVTSANFNEQRRKQQQLSAQQSFFMSSLHEGHHVKGTGGTKLFSRCIESGIVTASTFAAIQALPSAAQAEYENLTVDCMILYPRRLVAENGRNYDELCDRYSSKSLQWESILDLDRFELVHREKIRAEHVSLRLPLGEYAKQIASFRSDAQSKEGTGSLRDEVWKIHANSAYGVLASPFMDVNNFMAANQITATARAEAHSLMMALNGIQVITDGATYRRDQVPACTFEKCLELQPDYPIRRADDDDGIPFLDPNDIPASDDREFTTWYRNHTCRFFNSSSKQFRTLVSIHKLEHKKTVRTEAVSFDALAVAGCGDYLKLTRGEDDVWNEDGSAMRSYRRESKEALLAWIIDSFSNDQITAPPPIVDHPILLKYKQAEQLARAALADGIPKVFFPLGLEMSELRNYRIIKQSAFICQNPGQLKALNESFAWFQKEYGCGLEILALKQSYGKRRQGSINAIAQKVYDAIQDSQRNFKRHLNLTRPNIAIVEIGTARLDELQRRREEFRQLLYKQIDMRYWPSDTVLTGYIVSKKELAEQESTAGTTWLS